MNSKYKKHHHIPSTLSLSANPFYFWFDLALVGISILILSIDFLNITTKSLDKYLLIIISFIGILPVILSAFKALINKKLSIDLLASIALIFSLITQEWRSAVFIILMLASARLFARFTGDKSRRALQSLMKLRPTHVHIMLPNKNIVEKGIDEIQLNDLIVVNAGERLAIDGVVIEGEAILDQSSLTGESMPVNKAKGDEVLSSTLNVSGSLIVKATRVGSDTTFAKFLDLVEKSQTSKAPVSSIIDHFTSWYILFTFIFAVLIYFYAGNLTLVLSILLVTCADDLAVAVPLAFTAAIGAAAKRGIIIKAGVFLEGITKVKRIVFDKTGTITEGKPVVQSAVTFRKYPLKNFLALLGSVESESNHVLARAIVNYVLEKKIKITSLENVHEQPGFGMKAVKAGKTILVGKVKFLEENAIKFSAKENKLINDEKDKGRTITAVAIDQDLIGFVSLADGLRHNAVHVFKEIKNLGIKDLVMLTGDNEKTAAAVAAQIGVTEFKANLLPQDKIKHLQKYIGSDGKVIMIGDGVNDAAALALADIGMAMGAIGSDAAIESADIVLMKDNLENVPEVISLGKYTMRIVRQDLWIWGIVNTLGLFLVFAGVLGPSGAAAYNFITDFIPLMNSMRIFQKHKINRQKYQVQTDPKEALKYINEAKVTEI